MDCIVKARDFPTTAGVYCITNIINGKRYIGGTKNFRRRFAEHLSNLNRGIHSSQHLQSSWNKHGKEFFIFSIVEHVSDQSIIDETEQRWLNSCSPEYNTQTIVGSNRGIKRKPLSDEHKKKISDANKGIPLADWHREIIVSINKNRTPEHNKKISQAKAGKIPWEAVKKSAAARLGKPRSAEANRKTSEALKGMKRNEEQKRRMSIAQTGKKLSEEHRKKISISQTGRDSPMLGKKHTEEAKQKTRNSVMAAYADGTVAAKISETLKEKFKDNEFKNKVRDATISALSNHDVRKKMSESHKGDKNWRFGKPIPEEQKLRQIATLKARPRVTCPHCGKICDEANAKRWHFDKCKSS